MTTAPRHEGVEQVKHVPNGEFRQPQQIARFVHIVGDVVHRSLGIHFVSLSEQVDTFTPTGKMVFTVLGAVAELERSLIAERVKAGMRNSREKGKRVGRPPRTYLSSETRKAIARDYCLQTISVRSSENVL